MNCPLSQFMPVNGSFGQARFYVSQRTNMDTAMFVSVASWTGKVAVNILYNPNNVPGAV